MSDQHDEAPSVSDEPEKAAELSDEQLDEVSGGNIASMLQTNLGS